MGALEAILGGIVPNQDRAGKGDAVGPDLAGLTSRRDKAWVVRYLREPDVVLAKKDPIAVSLFEKYQAVRMPNLVLSDYQIATLLEYLEKVDAPAVPLFFRPHAAPRSDDPALRGRQVPCSGTGRGSRPRGR